MHPIAEPVADGDPPFDDQADERQGLPADYLFAEEDAPFAPAAAAAQSWKLLVVDDEPDVHAVTRVVLSDFRFADGGLEILSAYSSGEAQERLREHPDVALVLLDVVMEETDSGLRLVHYVREKLGNALVRIILRTGQPGYAPEREVIVRYDINDYKEKTELTAQKLFTTVVASLRAYHHLAMLEHQRAGLARIVEATQRLSARLALGEFGEGALAFAVALAGARGGLMARRVESGIEAMARVGEAPPAEALAEMAEHCPPRAVLAEDGIALVPVPSRAGAPVFVCLTGLSGLAPADRALLEVYAEAVGAGLDTVLLFGRLKDAQKAMVYALARLAEFRDADTGRHVRRVEHLVRGIALELRGDAEFAALRDEGYVEQLTLASILHDVGKVGIPDAVLNKPGALDSDERELVQRHAAIGAEILAEAASAVPGMSYISLAAEIAANHHELADGSGYPNGKRLAEIPLSARIVAVADVFDALVSQRPYKDGWPPEWALGWMREMAGRRFDPRVVEALAAVITRNGSALG